VPDKNIVCKGCSQEFVFTEAEQEFFKSKGLMNTPKRCKMCRKAKREATGEDPAAVWKDEPTGRRGGPA
jgi:hypothetical protein